MFESYIVNQKSYEDGCWCIKSDDVYFSKKWKSKNGSGNGGAIFGVKIDCPSENS